MLISCSLFFQCPQSGRTSSVLGTRQEEKVSFILPGLDDDEEDDDDYDEDKISENEVSLPSVVLRNTLYALYVKADVFSLSAESSWFRQTAEEPPS